MKQRILGIVGRSGNGKTTLLEHLLPELVMLGLRVNVIKHSHHDIQIEPPHKDSARLRMAGAAEVLVASPYRTSLVHELRGAPEPTLAEQLARLSAADLTLVEGFKSESIPKLEVYRPSVGKAPLYVHDHDIVAVASDVDAPMLTRPISWLNLAHPEQVLDWIMRFVQQPQTTDHTA